MRIQILSRSFLVFIAFTTLASCVMHFKKSQDYKKPEMDESLGFFYLDHKDMDGDLKYIYVRQVEPAKEWFIGFDDKSNVAYSAYYRSGKAYYVAALQGINSGFMASGAVYNYEFTPQTSMIRVKYEGKRRLIYLGAYKFKWVGKHNWLVKEAFTLEPCDKCSSELDQLKALLKVAETRDGKEIKEGNWVPVIEKRIAELEKRKP